MSLALELDMLFVVICYMSVICYMLLFVVICYMSVRCCMSVICLVIGGVVRVRLYVFLLRICVITYYCKVVVGPGTQICTVPMTLEHPRAALPNRA